VINSLILRKQKLGCNDAVFALALRFNISTNDACAD